MNLRTLALSGVALGLLLLVAGVQAQSLPGAPTNGSAAEGSTATGLDIRWGAPIDDGGSSITAYDLRYIFSHLEDEPDDQWHLIEGIWSSGALRYQLTDLGHDSEYALQLRAVNATGDGSWSEIFTGATKDHDRIHSEPTELTLGVPMTGRIFPQGDHDNFTFELTERADVWIFTSGSINTYGYLTYSGSILGRKNDDGGLPHGGLNFSLRVVLEPGTHNLSVWDLREVDTGPYILHTRIVPDHGNTAETATRLEPGDFVGGRLNQPVGSRLDRDWFKFTLTSQASVWILSGDWFNSEGTLYNADLQSILTDRVTALHRHTYGFNIRHELPPGDYYLKVAASHFAAHGHYHLLFRTVTGTTDSSLTAQDLAYPSIVAGHITSVDDLDYYRFTIERNTWLSLYAEGSSSIWLNARILDEALNEVDFMFYEPLDQDGDILGLIGKAPPGTYLIRINVRPTYATSAQYAMHLVESEDDQKLEDDCRALGRTYDDPIFGCQWHLNNTGQFEGAGYDINVISAWATTMGEGVIVAVIDDGVHAEHPDLRENVVAERNHDYHGHGVSHPNWRHGTQVSGIIAARDNNIGVRGVAPRASIYAYNLLAGFFNWDDEIIALGGNLTDTAVVNNSWGFPDRGKPRQPPTFWEDAIDTGLLEGNNGKGTTFIWAAGNGGYLSDDSNLDGRANYYGVVAVCAVDYLDQHSLYSEPGANLWVCAPSTGVDYTPGIATTTHGRYTDSFPGTSAAAPSVTGVVALMHGANPDLTWRDVKLILAASARKNHASDSGWRTGAARYGSSGGNYQFNHNYGFGVVDAGAAVAMAVGWTSPPAFRVIEASSPDGSLTIPDATFSGSGDVVTSTLTVAPYVEFIEFVEVNLDVHHDYFRNLTVELISPSGAVSRLVSSGASYDCLFGCIPVAIPLQSTFRMGSARHLGENAAGQWSLRIRDRVAGYSGRLKGWSVTVYGHGYIPGQPLITNTMTGTDALLVTWDPPVDSGDSALTSYDLRHIDSSELDRSDDMWTEVSGIALTAIAPYELTVVLSASSVDIQVRARNNAGPGAWSPVTTHVSALVAPHTPVIDSVLPRDLELEVRWPPAFDGGSMILRHDLRFILSDATTTDKEIDSNWTEIPVVATLSDGLYRQRLSMPQNNVSYDIQVRGVNGIGESDWSVAVEGKPGIQNTDPAFPSGSDTRSVREDAQIDANVGSAVGAIDGNSDTLAYAVSGAGGRFSIDEATGQLQVALPLDYETDPSHTVVVEVRDGKDSNGDDDDNIDDQVTVTIEVLDVNEAPAIIGENDIAFPENSSNRVAIYNASDPEAPADTVNWSLGGSDANHFELRGNNHGSRDLYFNSAPDYEDRTDYNVTIQASDGTLTGRRPVTIDITNVDEAETLVLATDQPVQDTTFDATFTEADHVTSRSWQWARSTSRNSGWTDISGETSSTYQPVFDDIGYYLRVTVNYNDPHGTDRTLRAISDQSVIRKRGSNRPPTFPSSETGQRTIPENSGVGTPVTHPVPGENAAVVAEDEDDDPLTYSLSGADSDKYEISGSGQITAALGAVIDYEDPAGPSHFLTVIATDLYGAQDTIDVTITSTDVNEAPEIRGQATHYFPEHTYNDIGVYIAIDPENDMISWTRSGDDAGHFSVTDGKLSFDGDPDYEAHADRNMDDIFKVTLIASDGQLTGTFDVAVTLQGVDEPPVISGLAGTHGSEGGELYVTLFTATDPEGAMIEWSIFGDDWETFTITNGELNRKQPSDYEAPTDHNLDNTYEITVRASDGRYSDTQDFIMVVHDEDEPPIISGLESVQFLENATRDVETYSAADPERQAVNWLALDGSDASYFILVDGTLRFKQPPDFEARAYSNYEVKLSASDGTFTGILNVTVNVQDVNEPPAIIGETDIVFTENSSNRVAIYNASDPEAPTNPVIWSLGGSDANQFELRGSNRGGRDLYFKSARNFEDRSDRNRDNEFEVTIEASDGRQRPNGLGTLQVAIDLTDLDEPESLMLSSDVPVQDVPLTATMTVADTVSSRRWQWARSTSKSSGWTDISGETSSTYQPLFDDIGYYLRVTVTYNDPHGTDKTLRAISDQSVVRNRGSNKPPKFPSSETGERTIPENSGVGTPVTHPVPGENAAVVAEDADDDPLTYSLSGADSDKYEISGSGQITAALGAVIDYEDLAGLSHFLTVIATDPFGAEDTIDVTITITDVNEAPEIDGLESVQFLENDTRDVASYNTFDPEGDDVSWLALTGSDASYFILVDGRLRFKQPPNYELRANSNYEVKLRASDGMFTGILNVTVNVQDVNEPPAIIGETDIVFTENSSNRVAIYNASDPEAPTNPVIWSLGGSDADQFELRGSSRGTRDLYFNSAPDYEDRTDYNVTILAADGTLTGRRPVTIDITNVDEPESLMLSSDVPVQDISLTATMTVADTVSSRRWQWARSTSMSSGWTDIGGEIFSSYQPVFDDIGYYLRVTVTYNDPHGTNKRLRAISDQRVIRNRGSNSRPMFPSSETGQRTIRENSGAGTQLAHPVPGENAAFVAEDADDDPLTYSLSGANSDKYEISGSGRITVTSGAVIDYETDLSHSLTVTARDPVGAEDEIPVTITITDVNEPPVAEPDSETIDEDTPTPIYVLENDSDPEDAVLTVTAPQRTTKAILTVQPDGVIRYDPNANVNGQDSFTYQITDGTHSATATVIVVIQPVNDAPEFPTDPVAFEIAEDTNEGEKVGQPVTATDVDNDRLTYTLTGGFPFDIESATGQIVVATGAPQFNPKVQDSFTVTVEARDPALARDAIDVTINVVEEVTPPITSGGSSGGGGGGGGPPPVPIPSDADFDWNVTRDVEQLDPENDLPTDIWSDGRTLWVVENSASGPDAVFAYDLETGERSPEQEFELDRRNRFSHGIWSDGETVWVADSGQDTLFSYDLESGERLAERDLELDERNRDPRGIWSDGETIYVLDSVKDALFIYDLDSGLLLTEYALDKLNQSPRGIWSDGVTVWVSDDGAKRLFAYRPGAEDLQRIEEEEFSFRSLLKAGNGDARGIWSDGDVIYVADEQDDKLYSYNIPDAAIAQLASLSLSDIELGQFSADRYDYAVNAAPASTTTVIAQAIQETATVMIEPADADGNLENGHQVRLEAETEIVITVVSSDGSRTKSYRVLVEQPPCLSGLTAERLSQVTFIGGGVDQLVSCARSLEVSAFYHYRDESWAAFFVDGPEFINRFFRNRFPSGLTEAASLIAKRQPSSSSAPRVAGAN